MAKSIFSGGKRPKKRSRGPFSPKVMSGRGGPSLGDQAQAAEQGKFSSEPGYREGLPGYEKGGVHRSGGPAVPVARTPQLDITAADVDTTKVISMMPAHRISIRDINVGSTKPVRVDVGIKDRTDLLICNMSDVVIWINTYAQYIAGQGHPLAPNTQVGGYNGATISYEAAKEVEFYAIGASGATNLVVVHEAAR